MLRSLVLAVLLAVTPLIYAGDAVEASTAVVEAEATAAEAEAPVATPEQPAQATETYRLKAETPRSSSADIGTASLQMTLGLLAVLAVIFGLSWLARRLNMAGVSTVGGLKVSAALSVGQKEKIIIVEVDGQRLLVGVTPHQITLLQTLGEAVANPAPTTDFAHRMQALLKSGSPNEK